MLYSWAVKGYDNGVHGEEWKSIWLMFIMILDGVFQMHQKEYAQCHTKYSLSVWKQMFKAYERLGDQSYWLKEDIDRHFKAGKP